MVNHIYISMDMIIYPYAKSKKIIIKGIPGLEINQLLDDDIGL